MAKTKAENEVDPEAVAADGYYSTVESDDNSVALSDTGFVGVSPEYANYANDTDKPLVSEDEVQAAMEESARAAEEERAKNASKVGFRGYEPTTPHPTERRGPAEDYIEANRSFVDRLLGRDEASGDDGGSGDDTETPSSPLGQ